MPQGYSRHHRELAATLPATCYTKHLTYYTKHLQQNPKVESHFFLKNW